jgi:hypothetical protein
LAVENLGLEKENAWVNKMKCYCLGFVNKMKCYCLGLENENAWVNSPLATSALARIFL